MFNFIKRYIDDELKKRFPNTEPLSPPTGYNSLDKIRQAMFVWLPVPFAGSEIWCKCRTLNRTQIEACGSFSLINREDKTTEPTKEEIIEMRNDQEALIKATLISPTFEEIEKFIFEEDNIMDSKKKEIEEIEKEISESKELNAVEKKELEDKLYTLKLFTGFVLPEDTFGFLTSWALGADISDIKKITRKQLYHAAILAKNGNDNPSDHISGIFSDKDKPDIDIAAWAVYNEHQELNKLGKGKKMRWIGGPMAEKG